MNEELYSYTEIVLTIGGLAVILFALVFKLQKLRSGGAKCTPELSSKAQWFLLVGIVTLGAGLRLIWWDLPLTAPWSFSQIEPLLVMDLIERGQVLEEWKRSWENFQTVTPVSSPFLIPISVALYKILPLNFHTPALTGGLMGICSLPIVFMLGRTVAGPFFGLLLAGFFAASPLEVVWSRTAGVPYAGTPHFILSLIFGYLAGKRKSYMLGMFAGLLTWCSLYYYFALRMVFPLTFLAIFCGLLDNDSREVKRDYVAMLAVFASALIIVLACFVLFGNEKLNSILWPTFHGYPGNKGEIGVSDFYEKNITHVLKELPSIFRFYFYEGRGGSELLTAEPFWGLDGGGWCNLSVIILGLLGLSALFAKPTKLVFWSGIFVCGVLIPLLSRSMPRRFLVMDLAWSAFAAEGLLLVIGAIYYTSRTRVAVVTVLFFTALSAWTLLSISHFNLKLDRGVQPIPWGQSFNQDGIADGLTCLRCLDLGKELAEKIKQNELVVLVDSDYRREGLAIPAGLSVYGHLAGLSAGRVENFVDFYRKSLVIPAPPLRALLFVEKDPVAEDLPTRISRIKPRKVVFHFERPNVWERWLTRQLEAIGGTAHEFATPLGDAKGVQVTLPQESYDELSELLNRTLSLGKYAVPACNFPELQLQPAGVPSPRQLLASGVEGDPWIPKGVDDLCVSGTELGDSKGETQCIDRYPKYRFASELVAAGQRDYLALYPTRLDPILSSVRRIGIGFKCGAKVSGERLTVNSILGTLNPVDPALKLGAGSWTGLKVQADRLLLSRDTGDLELYRLPDLTRLLTVSSNSIPLAGEDNEFGACTTLLLGENFIGSYNNIDAVLRLYDLQGTELSSCRLDQLVGVPKSFITAVSTFGNKLGVAALPNGDVRTYQIGGNATH